ncbi:MAG: hypothetical protein RL660_1777 [Bacteroidota bacterium]|jgi:hypothetical protein
MQSSKKTHKYLSHILLVVLFSVAFSACQGPYALKHWVVAEGIISDSVTSKPLPGVMVAVVSTEASLSTIGKYSARLESMAVTDAQGRYRFDVELEQTSNLYLALLDSSNLSAANISYRYNMGYNFGYLRDYIIGLPSNLTAVDLQQLQKQTNVNLNWQLTYNAFYHLQVQDANLTSVDTVRLFSGYWTDVAYTTTTVKDLYVPVRPNQQQNVNYSINGSAITADTFSVLASGDTLHRIINL